MEQKTVTFQKNPQICRCENLKTGKNNNVWEDYDDVKVKTAGHKRITRLLSAAKCEYLIASFTNSCTSTESLWRNIDKRSGNHDNG